MSDTKVNKSYPTRAPLFFPELSDSDLRHEEWRTVPGYEGLFEASSLGRVRSVDKVDARGVRHTGKVLNPQTSHAGGYATITLKVNGVSKTRTVHRLVALTFLGDPPPGRGDVCHNNGIKRDNRISNLRWGSRSENLKEHARSGLYRNQNTQKTHCIRGHEFNSENTDYLPSRSIEGNWVRRCRVCTRERAKRYRA